LVEETVKCVAKVLSREPMVDAIGLSTATLPRVKEDGDIDLFIYCSQPIGHETRERAYRSIPFSKMPEHRFDSKHWGSGDQAEICQIETWLMYFDGAEVARDLDDVCSGRNVRDDNGYYPVGRLAMIKRIIVLYERTNFLSGLKERLEAYPEEMRKSIIQYCRGRLENEEDLTRADARRDVLFYHASIDQAIDKLLQLVFAMNRTYFPSRKRNKLLIDGFTVKPADFYQRLQKVVFLGGNEDTLGQSLREYRSLKRDTLHLLDD
jgi:hypothetical protein